MSQISPGQYRHTKTGKLYNVVGVAVHTESQEELVVYAPCYKAEHQFFVRPLAMFTELVLIDGVAVARFEKLDD